MVEHSHRATDVFGITREIPLNYVTRTNVDEFFINSLTKDQHVVIFGSSKQGKTCLRKYKLENHDYIIVQCSNKWDLSQLHAAILKQAGFKIEVSDKRTISGKNKVVASGHAGLFGVGIKGEVEVDRSNAKEQITTPLELDPEDPNDIISALK